MVMTYANILDRVEQMLQDTSNATYGTAELGMWIEEGLKEFATYIPHIVPVIFKIESRTGTDVTGTTDKLTDSVKSQFLDADATYEKVIHNTTDHTWAIVEDQDSTSILALSADIMDANENYRIYNKRCWNEKQIYIGDVTDYLWIDSVEYPIGTRRNWKVYDGVLELDVDSVADSDSTLTNLGNVAVLVRFVKPHRLCQLTDLLGAVHTARDLSTLPVNALVVYNFTLTETCEAGDEFHIANHRNLYTCTEAITWSDNTNGNVLYFYPELEAPVSQNDVITFTKSTLQPQQEKMLIELIVAKALISKGIDSIGEVSVGGMQTWRNFQDAGERRLGIVLAELRRMTPPKTKRTYPKD